MVCGSATKNEQLFSGAKNFGSESYACNWYILRHGEVLQHAYASCFLVC